MKQVRCWGIFRERAHSPERESDDAEILCLTGKYLAAEGFEVILKTPDEVTGLPDARPPCIFLMCEGLDVLARLRAWERSGVRQVNSPRGVFNTYRERMIRQLRGAKVPFIQSRLISTTAAPDRMLLPVWVKRADVHKTQEADVVYAPSEDALLGALQGLAARGIPRAVLQPHVAGDLIKFYGIGGGERPDGGPPWFRCFYHKHQKLAGHAFDPAWLERLAGRAAAAVGLEVFGGDAIATAGGNLVLLDLNAWPSFALYRDEAAACIASHLASRFRGDLR